MSESNFTPEISFAKSFPLPSDGDFTQRFLRKQSRNLELYPTTVRVTHPERKQAIIGFAGFAQSHPKRYLLDQMEPIANATNRAAVAVEWSGVTDIPDLRWRRLADYIKKHHAEGITLFGTSFGGWEIFRGLVFLNKMAQEEGFIIPPLETIVAVAPTSGNSLQKTPIMDRKMWLAIKAAQYVEPAIAKLSGNVVPALISRSTRELRLPDGSYTSASDLRAIAVKARELANSKPFQPHDFPAEVRVHYFGTDQKGGEDPLVNQPAAIRELESAGVEVIPSWYDPDPEFPHIPSEQEAKRMTVDITDLLKQS